MFGGRALGFIPLGCYKYVAPTGLVNECVKFRGWEYGICPTRLDTYLDNLYYYDKIFPYLCGIFAKYQ